MYLLEDLDIISFRDHYWQEILIWQFKRKTQVVYESRKAGDFS